MEKLFSIITEDLDHCYLCGGQRHQFHHCMNTKVGKKKSEKYGLMMPVCYKCHSKIHDKDDNSIQIKKLAQRKFETIYQRDLWVKEFGKNYLWEEEE